MVFTDLTVAAALQDYATVDEARQGRGGYFSIYNTVRPHQAPGYQTPVDGHVEVRRPECNNVTGCNKKEREGETEKMLLLQHSTLKT